jgi:hypothetical protein
MTEDLVQHLEQQRVDGSLIEGGVFAYSAYTRWVANPSKKLRPVGVAASTLLRSALAAWTASPGIRPDTIT